MQQTIRELGDEAVIKLYRHWYFPGARRAQIPPLGDWRVWLLLAGRGFGKTRTGAEFVRACVKERLARRIALVAPTALDARAVMVEGESGLLSVGPLGERPHYEPSLLA
jgi:phage terminase large subunit-like protein